MYYLELFLKTKAHMENLGVAAKDDFELIVETINKAFSKPRVEECDDELVTQITEIATKQFESAERQIKAIRCDLNRILRSRREFLDIVSNKNVNQGEVFRDALAYAQKLLK